MFTQRGYGSLLIPSPEETKATLHLQLSTFCLTGVITKAIYKSSEEDKKEEEVKKTLEQHDNIVTHYKNMIREQVSTNKLSSPDWQQLCLREGASWPFKWIRDTECKLQCFQMHLFMKSGTCFTLGTVQDVIDSPVDVRVRQISKLLWYMCYTILSLVLELIKRVAAFTQAEL